MTAPPLREACIREALAIIEHSGLENLSLREVSRRLGVSHQAPYKHFPSRDHLLAEVVKRAFAGFGEHLATLPQGDDPQGDLRAMAQAYLDYATRHPLQYRLMFGTALPDPHAHPEMMAQAQHAFSLLQERVARLAEAPSTAPAVALDALFVWATIHGLATILESCAVGRLEMPEAMVRAADDHVLGRIATALAGGPAGSR
ncbi:MAG: TetR/AcrR family transcriptional regulator [Acidobacteriota bacterium]